MALAAVATISNAQPGSYCVAAPSRGKAPAAAERSAHAHLRADDREQPARTRIACRGRSVGATVSGPLRRAVAISNAGVRGPDAGRVVRHERDDRLDTVGDSHGDKASAAAAMSDDPNATRAALAAGMLLARGAVLVRRVR
jgi:hypothetical protein